MNLRQKKFITEKLIPFILREKGNGFVMERTLFRGEPGYKFDGDGVTHTMPDCGSAACVYGSVKILRPKVESVENAARILGIPNEAAYGLFYAWEPGGSDRYRWPRKHAEAFQEAETPLAKAKVAARLLADVVKTEGNCLDQEWRKHA